jgi:hypothetical protein
MTAEVRWLKAENSSRNASPSLTHDRRCNYWLKAENSSRNASPLLRECFANALPIFVIQAIENFYNALGKRINILFKPYLISRGEAFR